MKEREPALQYTPSTNLRCVVCGRILKEGEVVYFSAKDARGNPIDPSCARCPTPSVGTFEWMEAHARSIRDAKGPEYTVGSDNRLDNFDVAASQLGTTPFVVLAIFAAKHWASILSFCRNPDKRTSEPIEDRIADMINYLLLLYLMVYRNKKPVASMGIGDKS